MKSKHINNVDYDEREFEKIVKEHGGLIVSIIKNLELECGHFKISFDDLYQEGLIALYNAYKNYNKEEKAKFSTFAYMVISRSLKRYHHQQMNKYQNESYSLDSLEHLDYYPAIGDYIAGDHSIRYANEEKRDKLDKLFTILNIEDQHIVALRINKNSYKQIAEKLNITTKRVDNRLLRIKDRFSKNNVQQAI